MHWLAFLAALSLPFVVRVVRIVRAARWMGHVRTTETPARTLVVTRTTGALVEKELRSVQLFQSEREIVDFARREGFARLVLWPGHSAITFELPADEGVGAATVRLSNTLLSNAEEQLPGLRFVDVAPLVVIVIAAGLVMLLTVADPFERRRTSFTLPPAQHAAALRVACETSLCPVATEVFTNTDRRACAAAEASAVKLNEAFEQLPEAERRPELANAVDVLCGCAEVCRIR
ncbi:MAG: hypothetical protein GQE15_13405 [Archangiaceae bacterium]|nr:hypothetical protein [Archangiaceae bacterium]